jgi:hypothetical protein
MTPAEKAVELREKCDGYTCYAEVAVDEILYEFDHLAWNDDDYANYKIKYWKEVKKEIEKL